jgi:hypothetical protein
MGNSGDWASVFNAPVLAHVRGLRLASRLGPDGLTALARSPHLAGLASLDLGNLDGLAAHNLHLLFTQCQGWNLCRLQRVVVGLSAERVRQLTESSFAPHLRHLAIGLQYDAMAALAVLADSPSFDGLVTLLMAGAVSEAAAVALANAPRLPALRNLTLQAFLRPPAYQALATSPLLSRLHRLHLTGPSAGMGVLARAIAATPHCRLIVRQTSDELREILGPRLIME